MPAAEQEAKPTTLSTPTHEHTVESLTDAIDEWKRNAFLRALERRHAAVSYRVFIESARIVPTSSS